jgi:hypothetical protein
MREKIEREIVNKSSIQNTKGYVVNNEDNLIDGINLNLFQKDLMQGSGNELISKFNALFSSSALAVNNFAIIKRHKDIFSFLGHSGFKDATFERQFSTGLRGTPPNLDFVIENDEVIIAFESKYLELLDEKETKFKSSYNKDNLNYLDKFWFELIDKYNNQKLNLDVAQLIKHSIGLKNYQFNLPKNKKKRVILVYIYWTPNNLNKFEVYNKHSNEISIFSELLKKQSDLDFITMSYNDFWDIYNEPSIFKEHFDKLKNRYSIDV